MQDTPNTTRSHVYRPQPPVLAAHLMQDAAGLSRVVREHLPERDQLLYYGGLGALAASGMMSWPVAAATGTGVRVASRTRAASPEAGS